MRQLPVRPVLTLVQFLIGRNFGNHLHPLWREVRAPRSGGTAFRQRLAGKSYEAGGIGGRIERGYFAALLLDPATTDSVYGGKLTRYVRGETVGHLTVYRRATSSSSP